MVLDAIHAEREIPLKTAPLIFTATILTHLSAVPLDAREPPCSLAEASETSLAKTLRIDDNDRRVMIMCGMSAAFSALSARPWRQPSFPWRWSASESCTTRPWSPA